MQTNTPAPPLLRQEDAPTLTVNAYFAKHRIRLNRRDRSRLRSHLCKRVAKGYARRFGTKRRYTYRETDIAVSYFHILTHERRRHVSPQASGCCVLALLLAVTAIITGIIGAIISYS